MKFKERRKIKLITAFILFFFAVPVIFQSCARYIAVYDPIALAKAVSLKSEALNLVSKAGEPYADHEQEIRELMLAVDQAYEYAAGIPKNSLTVRQWEILKDPDRNLLAGFFKYWRQNGTLTVDFIEQSTGEITRAFDAIIKLETLKNR